MFMGPGSSLKESPKDEVEKERVTYKVGWLYRRVCWYDMTKTMLSPQYALRTYYLCNTIIRKKTWFAYLTISISTKHVSEESLRNSYRLSRNWSVTKFEM